MLVHFQAKEYFGSRVLGGQCIVPLNNFERVAVVFGSEIWNNVYLLTVNVLFDRIGLPLVDLHQSICFRNLLFPLFSVGNVSNICPDWNKCIWGGIENLLALGGFVSKGGPWTEEDVCVMTGFYKEPTIQSELG